LFFEAAETNRKLPPAIRKQKLSTWVDYPRDWHSYGWTQAGTTITKATPEQISRYDLALDLATLLDVKERKIVWGIAYSAAYRQRGAQWTKVSKMLGYKDPRIIKRQFDEALLKLYYLQK
tara:strand:+ start:10949 stop:11308 length:360 start_codon:yes stop_codon:yes gene_type:complete